MLKSPLNIPRLLAEIIAAIVIAEAGVMFILPQVAPGVSASIGAVLDATVLALMAGPVIVWRVMAAAKRASHGTEVVRSIAPWRVTVSVIAVLLGGVTFSFLTMHAEQRQITAEAHARFDRLAERLSTEAERRINLPAYGLKGAQGVYAASKSVERGEFRSYVASRNLAKEFPGALGFGFIKRVQRADLGTFVALERADQAPEFAVHGPAAPGSGLENAPDCYIIKFIEPLAPNVAAWGYDIGSEPVRRAAAERAAATGEPTITGKVTLVQDGQRRPGVLYMVPVYTNGSHPTTPQERTAALDGIVYAPIILEEAYATLTDATDEQLDFEVFDGAQPTADNQLFDHDKAIDAAAVAAGQDVQRGLGFADVRTIVVGGRLWTLVAIATPVFQATIDRTTPALIGMGGSALSVLLAAMVWSMGTSRGRALHLAESMTADLLAAKTQAERLAEIARRTSNAVVIADPQGRIEWANEGFTRTTGYTLDEVKGRTPGSFLTGPNTDPAASRLMGDAVRRGQGCRTEIVNYGKSGREYTLDVEIAALRSPAGVLTGFMAIESDITERKAAGAALAASEAKVRATLDASPVPMAINDGERITFLNPAFIRTFGYDTADIPTLADWWPKAYPDPQYRQSAFDSWQAAMRHSEQTGTAFAPVELNIRAKSGAEIVAMVGAVPIAAGSMTCVLVSLFDITARKCAERELIAAQRAAEAASRAKSAFLANMSHEIRTPLTAILGFADVLREDGDLTRTPQQRLVTIDTIRNAGQHLLTVINDILDLSKIEADKMTVERIETPVTGILREVESLMRPRAEGKGLSLEATLASPIPARILSDPTRLRQILMNLAGNAVKFTQTGTVTIRAGAAERDGQARLVIDVEDTGPGMTPQQAGRLFEAFGQADETVTRKHGGTGLGLTISRRLAALMGGDVKLLRTGPGQGSCFRLVIPLHTVPGSAMVEQLTAIDEARGQARPQGNATLAGRILLAEDGPDNQRLISFHLRKAGAQVTVADNGRIALEMLDKAQADGSPFDLLLTDMQMPEMDGYTLARTLRQRGSTLAIVALTAHAMAEDRARCIEAGCDDYATKPIEKATLLATCAAWMGKAGGVSAAAEAV